MSDTVTVTTNRSWFGRLGNSIVGVLIGIVLLLVCVVGLFWNEGRAVTTARSLAEGAGIVVSVTPATLDLANEGKLVHVAGPVATAEVPRDPLFGVSEPGLRLVRNVEMYQWQEKSESKTQTKLGGGEETVTTYTYSRGWSSKPEDSSRFKQPDGHANPSMEIRGEEFEVARATLGAFQLDERVIGRVGGAQKLAIGEDRMDEIRTSLSTERPVRRFDGGIYIGSDATSPRIGDYRVAFEVVPLDDISVVAQQAGTGLASYQTTAGDRLLLVESGDVPAAQMFENAVSENAIVTWIIRAVGLIFLMVAFALLLAPLGVIGDVIPFVGNLVRMGTGIVAFVMAVLVGSVVIGLAWLWYRPLLALGIVAGGAAIAWLVGRMGRKPAQAAPAAPSA